MFGLFKKTDDPEALIAEHREAEAEKLGRLDAAERRRDDLKARAAAAIGTLDARHKRNHWSDTVAIVFAEGKVQ